MRNLIPNIFPAHPRTVAECFLTEMLHTSKWDHLFRVMRTIDYPLMPREFYFEPQETILARGMQVEGDEMLAIFFSRYGKQDHSTIIVGLGKETDTLTRWYPNSLYIDLYIRSARTRADWGAGRCTIPPFRIMLRSAP